MMLPIAIAGPYAKRLDGVAAFNSLRASPGVEINRAVPATVAASLRRRSATITASTPPATAVNKNALTTSAGPTRLPIAAISFTSPAPGGAEDVPWEHQREPDREPERRRQQGNPTEARYRQSEAGTGHRRRHRIRDAASPDIHHGRDENSDDQHPEGRARNCWQWLPRRTSE